MNDIMELFLNEKVAVTFETEEAYDEFMKLCDKYEIGWSSGDRATELDNFGLSYCYDYDDGIMMDNRSYYEHENYRIIVMK